MLHDSQKTQIYNINARSIYTRLLQLIIAPLLVFLKHCPYFSTTFRIFQFKKNDFNSSLVITAGIYTYVYNICMSKQMCIYIFLFSLLNNLPQWRDVTLSVDSATDFVCFFAFRLVYVFVSFFFLGKRDFWGQDVAMANMLNDSNRA